MISVEPENEISVAQALGKKIKPKKWLQLTAYCRFTVCEKKGCRDLSHWRACANPFL